MAKFIEIEAIDQTTKNETTVSLNVDQIVFVEKSKTGNAIIKTTEPGRAAYNAKTSYEAVMDSIRAAG